MNGCDSIVTTNLTVNPTIAESVDISICEGESYLAGGELQTETGTYVDNLYNMNGCDSIVTTNLTVNPTDAESFNVSICEGESYLAGGEFQTETGTYIDNFSNINGCDSIITTNLVVNSLPVVDLGNDTTIYESITLDAGEGFIEYLWNTGDETQTILVDDSYDNGSYTFDVMVTDENSCQNGDTIIIDIAVSSSMINTSAMLRLYPNPSNGKFKLEIKDINEELEVKIYSNEGRVILSKEYNPNNLILDEIDLSEYNSGWYFINIKTNNFTQTEKFLIIK